MMTPLPESPGISARTNAEKFFCGVVLAGTLCYYWAVFFHYALDAGQADDFVDILWFMEIFLSRQHWQEWLAVIALPNHEHVTIFNHLVYLLDYFLFGKINFFHCILLGHAVILACCMVLAEWLRRSVGWWYALALAFGVFLNLFYWHAGFWAMTALSNQAVILFALLAARSAARNKEAIVAPLCWSLLAIITQFNGLLVLPALVMSNFLCARAAGKSPDRLQSGVWLIAFVLTSAAYTGYENPFAADHLWRYVQYADIEHLQDYIKPSFGQPVPHDMWYWLRVPFTWLTAIGASIFGLAYWVPAALAGITMLAMLLRNGVRMPVNVDRFWWCILLFVLASLALVAMGRGLGFGEGSGLLYRYRLYSFLLLVLLCGSVLRFSSNRKLLYGMLSGCVFIQIASLHVLDDIDAEKNNIKISHYNWLVDGGMGRTKMPFYPHNQDVRLFNAYNNDYYSPYEAIDVAHKPVLVESAATDKCADESKSDEQGSVQAWSKKAKALAVELRFNVSAAPVAAEFLFCGQSSTYRLTLDTHNIDEETGTYWPVLVLKKQLPPSQYRVLWRRDDGSYTSLGSISFL